MIPSVSIDSNTIANRLNGYPSHGEAASFSCVSKIMSEFFYNRYADARIFVRAVSLIKESTPEDATNRAEEIEQFKENLEIGRQGELIQRFNGLSEKTRQLFFFVDHACVEQYVIETNSDQAQALKEKMLRECTQVIKLQYLIAIVKTVCGCCFQGSGSSDRPIIRQDSEIEDIDQVDETQTVNGIDLNIPGTAPYLQNAIPNGIVQKGRAIEALLEYLNAIEDESGDDAPSLLNIPEYFNCAVMKEVMTIPVFDASHPGVQNELPTIRQTRNLSSSQFLNAHRTKRHALDASSFERHMSEQRSYNGIKCPTCRHPEDGSMRREYMRIDTGLQDAILDLLKRQVLPRLSEQDRQQFQNSFRV